MLNIVKIRKKVLCYASFVKEKLTQAYLSQVEIKLFDLTLLRKIRRT